MCVMKIKRMDSLLAPHMGTVMLLNVQFIIG